MQGLDEGRGAHGDVLLNLDLPKTAESIRHLVVELLVDVRLCPPAGTRYVSGTPFKHYLHSCERNVALDGQSLTLS